MTDNNEIYKEIATRIYNLDTKVYENVGSSLGRTFIGTPEKCINDLIRLLCSDNQSYTLRSEMALVANMARTIRDKKVRNTLMREYNNILQLIQANKSSFTSVDILSTDLARLNSSAVKNRISKNDHLIICISRSHGSAGADIGFALADKLRINYYDVEVLNELFKRIDEKKDIDWDATPTDDPLAVSARNISAHHSRLRDFSRYHGLPKADAAFFTESTLLCEMAAKEDFVVIGRCADTILSNNHIPHISIYITAPFEARAKRMMEADNISFKTALKQLIKIDRKHERFYRKYTGKKWGSAINYDLCINSAAYGIDEAVELIMRIINREAK